ncbi:MAG: hypothetical protein IPM82_24615 [Saprospiraceae bacterium]|nr:hypothetical protein [Saprospiraceae bacterium]
MNRESLYEKVFAGQAYNDAKWRNLVFKMNKLTEEYLVWLELQKAETTRQKLLTTAYGNRNLYNRFEKNATELSQKLATQSQKSADAPRERMLASLQFYHHPKLQVDNLDKLQSAMDDLDHYHFAEKLRLACDLKVAENMVVGASPIRLINEVSGLVKQGELRTLDYLKIYVKVFDLLTQPPTMEAFQTAFVFFTDLEKGLSDADRQFGLCIC